MRFHLLPLVLFAVVTLDVITAHPGRYLQTGDTVKVPRKGALAKCREVVQDISGGLSRLAARARERRRNKKEKKENAESWMGQDSGYFGSSSPTLDDTGMLGKGRAQLVPRPQVPSTSVPQVSKKLVGDNNGKVYICEDEQAEESPYVLKALEHVDDRAHLENEFRMHGKAYKACPDYVTRPYDYEEDGDVTSFKSQYGDGGVAIELFRQMYDDENTTLDDYRVVFFHMAKALECLHNKAKMAHLDIKPENYVLRTVKGNGPLHTTKEKIEAISRGDVHILLIDFGTAVDTTGSGYVHLRPVTPDYDAPEAILSMKFLRKNTYLSDVCSLGRVFMFMTDPSNMLAGNIEMVIHYRQNGLLGIPSIDDMEFFEQEYPSELYAVVKLMTSVKAKMRKPLNVILNHSSFFKPMRTLA